MHAAVIAVIYRQRFITKTNIYNIIMRDESLLSKWLNQVPATACTESIIIYRVVKLGRDTETNVVEVRSHDFDSFSFYYFYYHYLCKN